MSHPRDLVCDVCWTGLFDTQEWQDLFLPLPTTDAKSDVDSEDDEGEDPRKVTQYSSFKNVRKHCTNVTIQIDIGTIDHIPNVERESDKICNWCEYLSTYSFCGLDEDGKPPKDDEDLLRITFDPKRVEHSTPVTAPGAGGKVMMLSLDRCNRTTGESVIGNGSYHHAYTPADDPAAAVIASRPLRKNVSVEEIAAQLPIWIQGCEDSACGENDGFHVDVPLPRRVIDVGSEGGRKPRVVETNGGRGVFGSLSYCWGGEQKLTLRRATLSQLQAEIDMELLPRTIQDAILVTRSMNVQYLWVDALCILQDDELDKTQDIARMQDIYAASSITIVASGAEGASEGFLARETQYTPKDQHRRAVTIPVRLAPGKFGTMTLVDLNDGICYEENWEPLSGRAWSAQEQLLAQRRLTFTGHNKTMTWSCPHSPLTQAYGDSMFLPYWPSTLRSREEDFLKETLILAHLGTDPKTMKVNSIEDKEVALSRWKRFVTVYSLRSASLPNDKLNAVAGICARLFAPFLGPGYAAGLWECDLRSQLLWTTTDHKYGMLHVRTGGDITRPNLDCGMQRAPSWSWASIDGGVVDYADYPPRKKFMSGVIEENRWVSEIVSASATPKFGDNNKFGEITPGSGRLTMRTKLRRAWLHPESHSIFRPSCAPTPVTSRSSSRLSSRSAFEENDDADESAVSPSLSDTRKDVDLDLKSVRRESVDSQDLEATPKVGSSSEPQEGEISRRLIPTFNPWTQKYSGYPEGVEFVSPFKRAIRRTGNLPADSDSEYDSADSDDEGEQDMTKIEQAKDTTQELTRWWNVGCALDEQKAKNFGAYRNFDEIETEEDTSDAFLVYMVPLAIKERVESWGLDRDSGYQRNGSVDGLLLVKDRKAMEEVLKEDGVNSEGRDARKRAWKVLFRRIGTFSSCPLWEFEKAKTREITVV